MNEELTTHVRAASVAAWKTVLVAVILMTLSWLVFLGYLYGRPEFVRSLWGGGELTWKQVQVMGLWFFGAFKIVVLIMAAIALWLTFWASQLRNAK